jgi:hypothetical protein
MRTVGTDLKLAVAQLAIARENGFASWRKLKAELERRQSTGRATPLQRASESSVLFGEPALHQEAWTGAEFDDVLQTERDVHHHQGTCRQCGVSYEFETNVVRGFSDFVEAFCPGCGASIGKYREDIGVSIPVRVAPNEFEDDDLDDYDWADDTDLPGFRGWTDQGTPIQEI